VREQSRSITQCHITINACVLLIGLSGQRQVGLKQESCAIAKTTAQCALYIAALKIFDSLLSTPTATFPEIFNRLLFRSILWMCAQNLKFIALPVPEIIQDIQKHIGSPWICPRCLFSKIFDGLLFGWTLWMYGTNLKSVSLPVPEITAIEFWVGVAKLRTPSLRK